MRWAEMYEDGQGMGQNTAACAPVYDKSVTPPDLFGVVCNSILKGDLDALSNWPAEWVKMKTVRENPHIHPLYTLYTPFIHLHYHIYTYIHHYSYIGQREVPEPGPLGVGA